MNINNVNKFNIKELDDKINSELSTIHNINNENFNFMKTLDIEPDTLENNKNLKKNRMKLINSLVIIICYKN